MLKYTTKQTAYLASEGDGSLVQSLLLWIPDVGIDDLVERMSMVGLLEVVAQLLCLDGELAAHSVLNTVKSGIYVSESGAHGGLGGL